MNGTSLPVRDYEANLEITYRAEIVPGINVQPHPGASRLAPQMASPARNALVAGFRTILRF